MTASRWASVRPSSSEGTCLGYAHMPPSSSALAADWLSVCRQAVEGLREMLAGHPTTRERAVETGRGEGGDMSLVIDCAAEDVVFAELAKLSDSGHSFTALSEERG